MFVRSIIFCNVREITGQQLDVYMRLLISRVSKLMLYGN